MFVRFFFFFGDWFITNFFSQQMTSPYFPVTRHVFVTSNFCILHYLADVFFSSSSSGSCFFKIPSIIIKQCNSSLCLNVYPIICHFLLFKESINVLSCPIVFDMSSFVLLCIQFIFCKILQHHITIASNIFLSFLLIFHVSFLYKTTLQTYIFMNLFFILIFLDINNFFYLRNVFFA